MAFDWKPRILTTTAALSLVAGAALAAGTDQATTDSSRAAEDKGAVQTMTDDKMPADAKAGVVQSPADPDIADNAPSAADIEDKKDNEMQKVDTDTAPGTATGPKADPETVTD